MVNQLNEERQLVFTSKKLENGRVAIIVDEDACDAIFADLETDSWTMDMYKSDQSFTPIFKAIRRIKEEFHSQNEETDFSSLNLDEQTLDLLGAVFHQHFTHKLTEEIATYDAEVLEFLATATPKDIDLGTSKKFKNPTHVYLDKINDFYHDIFASTGNQSPNILNDYVKATLPQILKLGLAFDAMRKDDKDNEQIERAREGAIEFNFELIANNQYVNFILDGTDHANQPYISRFIDLVFNTSFKQPLSEVQSLSVFLGSIKAILRLQYFTTGDFYHFDLDKALTRKLEFIKAVKRQYSEMIKARGINFSDFIYKYPFHKDILNLLVLDPE